MEVTLVSIRTVQKCSFHIYSMEENVRGVSNGKSTVSGRWIMKAHKVWSLGSRLYSVAVF
jgi:hypothetical protein